MASTWLMYLLIAEYVAIAVAAAWERNWLRVLYYLGATLISLSVLGMSSKGKG